MFWERSIMPAAGPEFYKTYELRAPISTHRREASCREVSCDKYARGWRMGFDITDAEKAAAVKWIRMHSGRHFTLEQVGSKVILTFPAGQNCFDKHTTSLEREPFYIVRDGDFRGNPRGTALREHTADNWVDDFANHQDRIMTQLERG